MKDFNQISALASKINAFKDFNKNKSIDFSPNLDAEAESLFTKIDDKELNIYLKTVIVEAFKNKDKLVDDYYDNRIEEIFTNYLSFEIDDEMNKFKKEISVFKRNDNSVFNKAYKEATSTELKKEDAVVFIANKVQGYISSAFRYTNKIIELSNFKSAMTTSIIFNTLFEQIEELEIFKPTDFEKLFINRSDFYNIKEQLLQKNYVIQDKGKYYWHGNTQETDLNSKKLICTLGLVLYNKNYLRSNKDTSIVNALNSFFYNESITKTTYGRYRKEYEDLDKRRISLYYNFYSFISNRN